MAASCSGRRDRRSRRCSVSFRLKPQSMSSAPAAHSTRVEFPRLPLPSDAKRIAFPLDEVFPQDCQHLPRLTRFKPLAVGIAQTNQQVTFVTSDDNQRTRRIRQGLVLLAVGHRGFVKRSTLGQIGTQFCQRIRTAQLDSILFRFTKDCFNPACITDTAPLTTEPARPFWRSEEHTSELQSRENLVCRLLLEKKKNTRRSQHT